MEITILSHSPFLYFFLGNPPWQLFSVCQSGLGICSFTLFLFFSVALSLFCSFALSLFCSLSLFHSLLFALSFLLFALSLFCSSLFSSSLFHSSLFSSSLFSSLLFRSLPLRSSLFHSFALRSFALSLFALLLFALCSLLFCSFALLLFRSLFFSFALSLFRSWLFCSALYCSFCSFKKGTGTGANHPAALFQKRDWTELLRSLFTKRVTGANHSGHSLQKEQLERITPVALNKKNETKLLPLLVL